MRQHQEFIYCFPACDYPVFKCGRSNDPHRRAMQLPVKIDLQRSWVWPVLDNASARFAEATLHGRIASLHAEMPKGDGSSEWFRIEAVDQLREFVTREHGWLDLGSEMPVPPLLNRASRRAPRKRARDGASNTSDSTNSLANQSSRSLSLTFELWDEYELSRRIGVSVPTIRSWRSRGGGPPFVKIGRRVAYRPTSVEEHFLSQERSAKDR